MSLFKALMLFRLLNRLRQQGRFSYTSGANYSAGTSNISLNDAYAILDCKKGDTKEKILSNFKKLQKKLHPDLNKNETRARSPEASLQEGEGLASAIDLNVVYSEIIRIKKLYFAT